MGAALGGGGGRAGREHAARRARVADHARRRLPNVAACSTDGPEVDERLVAEYLAAREPHDRDVLTPADAAGAVAAVLALGRERVAGPSHREGGQPESRGGRVGVTPHRRRGGERRRPVPRRQRELGAGAPGLRHPPLVPTPVGRAGRGHHVAPAHRDRPRDRPRRARSPARRDRERRRRRVHGGGRLGRDSASRSAASPTRCAHHRPAASVPTRPPRSPPTSTGWPTTTSPSWGRWRSTPSGVAVPGSELGVARRRPLFDLDDADPAPTGLLTLTARAGAVDGAPRRAARFRHRAPSRSRRCHRRRAAAARPLHRQRLQRQRRAHPRGAPEGRRGGGEVRASRPTVTTGAPSSTCSRRTRATSCSASAPTSSPSSRIGDRAAWGCAAACACS